MDDPEVGGFNLRETVSQAVRGVLATWISIICLGVGTLACNQGPSTDEWVRDSVRTAQTQAARELAHRYPNAILYDSVLAYTFNEKPYTVDVQRALLDSGRPVLVRANLQDVVRVDDRHVAVFNVPWLTHSFDGTYLIPEAYFNLWVEPTALDRLLSLGRDVYRVYGTDFLIAVEIDGVKRPGFIVEGEVQYDGDFGYSELHAEPAEFFSISGNLLGFVYLGDRDSSSGPD